MAVNEKIYYSVPKSFVMDIVNVITMVGTLKEISYRKDYDNPIWDGNIDEYLNSKDENFPVADIYLLYEIDDDMQYSFEIYLDKYVQKFSDNMLHLEKCLAVKEND